MRNRIVDRSSGNESNDMKPKGLMTCRLKNGENAQKENTAYNNSTSMRMKSVQDSNNRNWELKTFEYQHQLSTSYSGNNNKNNSEHLSQFDIEKNETNKSACIDKTTEQYEDVHCTTHKRDIFGWHH